MIWKSSLWWLIITDSTKGNHVALFINVFEINPYQWIRKAVQMYNLFTFQKAFEKFNHKRLHKKKKMKSESQSVVIYQKTVWDKKIRVVRINS